MPQSFKDMFPDFGGLDINQLLQQQAGFTRGFGGNVPTGPSAYQNIASGPIALNANFDPTLAQMLQTGAPVDVSQAVAGERGLTEQRMQDMIDQFNARMGAMGKVGSTAHAAKQARGTQGLLADLFARTSGLEVESRERAAGRRMGAMDTALGKGRLDLGARQADLQRAGGLDAYGLGKGRLGLAEKTGQAGAGMDMLKLLSSFAGKGGAAPRVGAAGGARVAAAPQRMGTVSRPSYGGGQPASKPRGLAKDPFLAMNLAKAGRKRGGGMTGFGMSDNQFLLSRPDLMQQYGILSGQGDVAQGYGQFGQTQANALGKLMGGSAAQASAIMPMLMQLMQQQQQGRTAQQYGPGYAFGG